MDLSIILVHYHTPALVVEAVAALRRDLATTDLEAEILLVDNGSEPEDRPALHALGLKWIDPGGNTGYAGGVNRGVAAARAPHLVVMNPDVLVRPGCLAALHGVVAGGTAAAGPRFFWDRGERLLLPLAEARTRRWEWLAARAAGSARRGDRALTAWRRHARAAWEAREPYPTHDLSGALLAFRRDAFDRIGPFDEGYRLYFEETDWLHRLRRAGLSALYLPAARAVHLFNRSAGSEPKSAAWFADSQARFRRRAYGPLFARLLEAVERRVPAPAGGAVHPIPPDAAEVALEGLEAPCWVEVSPSPLGFPAAAEWVEKGARWRLPEELVPQVRGYWLRWEASSRAFASSRSTPSTSPQRSR
jgi:GT2 family glycosyltransferase